MKTIIFIANLVLFRVHHTKRVLLFAFLWLVRCVESSLFWKALVKLPGPCPNPNSLTLQPHFSFKRRAELSFFFLNSVWLPTKHFVILISGIDASSPSAWTIRSSGKEFIGLLDYLGIVMPLLFHKCSALAPFSGPTVRFESGRHSR